METDETDGRTQVTGWPTVQVGLALYPGSILALGLELLRPIPGPRKRLMLEGIVKQNISKFFLPSKRTTYPFLLYQSQTPPRAQTPPLASSFIFYTWYTVENKNISVTD